MDSDTKLTVTDATYAKSPANLTSPRPESNGTRPGPGFGQKSVNKSLNLILLTRAILGKSVEGFSGLVSLNNNSLTSENSVLLAFEVLPHRSHQHFFACAAGQFPALASLSQPPIGRKRWVRFVSYPKPKTSNPKP